LASVWDVTVAEVARLARLQFSADTQPATADVEAWITESGSYLDGLLGSLGVDDVTSSTYPEAYAIGRRWIAHDVAAIALRARARGGTSQLADDLQARADRLEERIEKRVARLGDAHPRGDDAANLARSPMQGTTDADVPSANTALFDPRQNVKGRL